LLQLPVYSASHVVCPQGVRSEERRVGKEC